MHLHHLHLWTQAHSVRHDRGLTTNAPACAGDGDPGHSLQPSGAQQHGE